MTRLRRLIAAIAAPLAAAMILGAPLAASAGTARAGVQDFSFTSYSADYYLAQDAGGHSTLRTVETFVAKFPSFDQNRGMIRAIPNDYDGVPLHTAVTSVTDKDGSPVHFEATDSGDFTELALGTDEYVHGTQSYVITYTQQNVVRAFTDTNDDELYWDTNGTGFAQPFGAVTARVHVDPTIVSALTGHNACYRGTQESTDTCAISQAADDPSAPGGKLLTAQTSGLGPNENLTVAIGFTANTFVQVPAESTPPNNGYQDGSSPFGGGGPFGLGQTPWWSTALAFFLLALGGLGSVFAILQRFFFGPQNAKGRGIIVPQYSPPKDLNLLEAANLIGRTEAGLPAQLVSFAVRGNIRILDYPVTDGGADYTLQFVRADGVDAHELRLLEILFGEAGALREVGVTNDSLALRLKEVDTGAAESMKARGFTVKPRMRGGLLTAAALFVVLFVSIGLTVITAMLGVLSGWMLLAIAVAFVSVFIGVGTAIRRPVLTESGAEQRDYLLGVRDYLQLAEADRFRMLQSPEGAERVDVGDRAQMVKLYEKLLPFAVLWGIEREWSKELAVYYEQDASSPDWYVSNGAFSSLVFAQSLGLLASSVTTTATPTPPPSSSRFGGSFSGGSFGGGFSGGGGGGGGGGGR